MKKESARKWLTTGVLALALLVPGWAAATEQVTFDRIVVFGASVSDPGNAYALIKLQNTPPYDDPKLLDQEDRVPCAPYAVGAHHFSNGATWVEQLAKSLGLYDDVGPAFQDTGRAATNYAIGGTRARNDATTLS
ncbi:MAG: GDSL family lipase, partial [Pseudogulbenkiania sp.]|nr:GDSL family lipase [Pseudogulbenkiania sp.]